VNGVILLLVGAALSSVPEGAKVGAATAGKTSILQAFDPHGLRAFDYSRLAKASPADWLRAASLTIEPDPEIPVDRAGVVSPVLSLPPGRYEASVWFQSSHPHEGDLQLLAGRRVLARRPGPLPSPSELKLDFPVALPGVRLQLTNPEAAQSVSRIEIVPIEVVPVPERPRAQVRAVEPIPGREQAYIAYIDYNSHPEGGVFWTRGTEPTTVLLVPAGARQLELTIYTGPRDGPVQVSVAGEERQVLGKAGEAQVVEFDVPAGARVVPVRVQATTSFRPVDVDPKSTDTRVLGSQVRLAVR
jgi:hypothetical protein